MKATLFFCALCGKWIHGRCAGVKMVTPRSAEILHAENVKRILERQRSRK